MVDTRIVDALIGRQARAEPGPDAVLSPRERDVMREMARGLGNGGIARELVLSESAVEKHVGAILRELGSPEEDGVHRRVSAVLAYLRIGEDGEQPGVAG